MKKFIIILFALISVPLLAQKGGRKVALEKTNKTEYQAKLETLKKDPNQDAARNAAADVKGDTSKKVSAFEKSSKRERKKMDATTVLKSESKTFLSSTNTASLSASGSDTSKKGPTPANTSAIAHGEARTPSAAVAKNYKYKADEKSVEYYNELRKKFEEEEKVRKEKEALMAIEKAKKEEEVKQGRRLSEDQAPQFDKFRQGEKNPVVKKTTAEEDYKSLFK